MKKLLLLLLLVIPLNVFAEEAKDITNDGTMLLNNNQISSLIKDKDYKTSIDIKNTDSITISNANNIAGLYIIYKYEGTSGSVNYNNKKIEIGKNKFAHEYIKLDGNSNNITIKYENSTNISEIYILSSGDLPNYIQNWNQPLKEADLLLFSTHGDDEQLFFLGLMPTYIDRGLKVQVAYLANHNDNPRRIHEQLNGLWEVGIKNYPIFGIIPDAYSETLAGAVNNLSKVNITEEDVIKFQTSLIRRFKPLVVVGHDELGEYSHGQHILNTDALKQAIERSNDNSFYNDLEYKPWEVKKIYLHLYGQNKIIMDFDVPLKKYNNLTAYEVSKKGYLMHESQQWTWFTKWINGSNNEYTKATQITKYSPCQFGLYKSAVGEDINKNDMFENIELRKEKKVVEKIKESVKKVAVNNKNDYKMYIICASSLLVMLFIIICSFKKKRK